MKNQESFTLPILLLVAVVAGIFFYWQTKRYPQPQEKADERIDIATPSNTVVTSNWLTFKHEVFPYEIMYPPGAKISLRSIPAKPTSFDGEEIEITLQTNKQQSYIYIYATPYAPKHESQNLKEYLLENQETASSGGVPHDATPLEEIAINNWKGYRRSTTYNLENSSRITSVFTVYQNTLYRISYSGDETLIQQLLQTLQFNKLKS